jgi:hypothetical protein
MLYGLNKIDVYILNIQVRKMSIIMLRGFSHSGKDFIGNILCNSYGYKRFAFADSLKIMVAKEFNCPVEILHSQEGKLQICDSDLKKRTYRQILIDEALRLRNINAGVFAKHCCNEISNFDYNKVVITDWRYPNEIDIVKAAFPNYIVSPVHIIRSGQTKSPVNDISEYQLEGRTGDYQIVNNLDESVFKEIKLLINSIDS